MAPIPPGATGRTDQTTHRDDQYGLRVSDPPLPSGSDGSGWVRVAASVAADDAIAIELVGDALWRAGAAGVEERLVEDRAQLIGGFDDPDAAGRAQHELTQLGAVVEVLPLDDDGLDAWREWAVPERAGHFWITPTWVERPALADGEEVLWIDPGRTFGSGSHPTTRLVLAALETIVRSGDRVLDVGCGSGVLAVGAARLGAAAVDAIDIDPMAPAATLANAERNGVAERVEATGAPLHQLAAEGRRYQVVAANLLAVVIAELAPDLVACVAPGGVLVASGLLHDEWEPSAAALAPLRVTQVTELDGWAAVTLTAPQ